MEYQVAAKVGHERQRARNKKAWSQSRLIGTSPMVKTQLSSRPEGPKYASYPALTGLR